MAKAISMRGLLKDSKSEKTAEKNISKYVKDCLTDAMVPKSPFEVGKNYLIRTITMIDIGKVKAIIGYYIILENASWIGDTGRFNECLTRNDIFNEVEPFKNDVYLNLNAIVDATPWPYALPTAPK